MSRESTKAALDRFYQKEARKHEPGPPRRKNKAPEKEVEKEVLAWLKRFGFFCQVIEAKAVYNEKTAGYVKGQVAPGYPDVSGVTPCGMGCFIELKAPSKRANLSFNQYKFLKRAIGYGCFAIVADSAENVEFQYRAWQDGEDLMAFLPKKKWAEDDDDSPLF